MTKPKTPTKPTACPLNPNRDRPGHRFILEPYEPGKGSIVGGACMCGASKTFNGAAPAQNVGMKGAR